MSVPCPCGLTKAEVVDLDTRDRVPLVGGKCQNPHADGTEGVCGKALGAHPVQGKLSSIVFICCSYSVFHLLFN